MYFQLFVTSRLTGKQSQISCDSMAEVCETLEARKPKFIKVEYYNSFGLVGVGYQFFNIKENRFVTYRKIVEAGNPANA